MCSEAKADEFITTAKNFLVEKRDENSYRIIENPKM